MLLQNRYFIVGHGKGKALPGMKPFEDNVFFHEAIYFLKMNIGIPRKDGFKTKVPVFSGALFFTGP
jgi:hypothetical protein